MSELNLTRARKSHCCCWCNCQIEPGELYHRAKCYEDSPPSIVTAHRFCQESCSRYLTENQYLDIEPPSTIFAGWWSDFHERHGTYEEVGYATL